MKDRILTKNCKIYRTSEHAATREDWMAVPIEKRYQISLQNDAEQENLTANWDISAFEQGYMLFSENGSSISGSELPNNSGYIVFDEYPLDITTFDVMIEEVQCPESMAEGTAYYLSGISTESKLTFTLHGKTTCLWAKANTTVKMIHCETLFGEQMRLGENPVFTVFPDFEVYATLRGEQWAISLQGQNGITRTIGDLGSQENGKWTVCGENLLEKDGHRYGMYYLKIYADSKLKKVAVFYYFPKVEYDETHCRPWPIESGEYAPSLFLYRMPEDVSIEWDDDSAVEQNYGGTNDWNLVQLTGSEKSELKGSVIYHYKDESVRAPFRKTLRCLRWHFWNDDGSGESKIRFGYARMDHIAVREQRSWLSVQSTPVADIKNASIEFRSEKGAVISIPALSATKNVFNIALWQETETISEANLPVAVWLSVKRMNGSEEKCRIAEIYERPVLDQLQYRCDVKTSGRPVLIWRDNSDTVKFTLRIIGISDPEYELRADLRKGKPDRNKPECKKMLLSEVLPAGVYALAIANDDPEDPFADDMIENDLFANNQEKWYPILPTEGSVLHVGAWQTREIGNVFDLMANMLNDYTEDNGKKLEYLRRYTGVVEQTSHLSQKRLDAKEIKLLILFVLFTWQLDENSSDMISLFRTVLDYISSNVLTPAMRAEITLAMGNMQLRTEEADYIFRRLDLFLFTTAGIRKENASEDLLQQIGNLDRVLEILWRIRLKKNSTVAHAIVSILGTAASKKMLKFHRIGECTPHSRISCLENNLSGKCRCLKLALSCDIVGTSSYFSSMQKWSNISNRSVVKLDMSALPQDEVEVCGSCYTELLIKWMHDKDNKMRFDMMSRYQKEAGFLAGEIDKKEMELPWNIMRRYKAYEKLFISREEERNSSVSIHHLFRYTALAAYLEGLYAREEIGEGIHEVSSAFLAKMMRVSSDLVRRDMIVAELYLFAEENGGR